MGTEELGGAVGAGIFAGAVVVGDAGHLVLRADGDDEFDVRVEAGACGGEEGEASGEAEAENADGTVVLLGGEPCGGIADGVDGVGTDVVVLDVGEFRGEDSEAAGGHGGGEGDEAGLIDTEIVDAVEDDDGGRVGAMDRGVEASADGAVG